MFSVVAICIVLAVFYFYRGGLPSAYNNGDVPRSEPLCAGKEGDASLCGSPTDGSRHPQVSSGNLQGYAGKHINSAIPRIPANRAAGSVKSPQLAGPTNASVGSKRSDSRMTNKDSIVKGTVPANKSTYQFTTSLPFKPSGQLFHKSPKSEATKSTHSGPLIKQDSPWKLSKKHNANLGAKHKEMKLLNRDELPTRQLHQVKQQFSSSSSQFGYVITQTYGGQMTRAIKNMMIQQCWAGTVGDSLRIVEPFSSESNLFHAPRFWDALRHNQLHEAATFSEYYDLDYFNKLSQKEKGASVVKWNDFLNNAPRAAVVVTIPPGGCRSLSSSITSKRQYLSTSKCKGSKSYQEFLQGLLKLKFSFVKELCVDCSHLQRSLTLAELQNELYGGRNVSETTLIFSGWRSFNVVGSWLQLPSYCINAQKPDSSTRLVPSLSVLNHTNYYRKRILKSKKVIAVMLRIERFLTLKVMGRSNETVDSCLSNTLKIHEHVLQNPKMANSSTFLTLDIGRFGSGIMKDPSTVARFGQDSLSSIREAVYNVFKHLYKGHWTMSSWEQSFIEATSGIAERGYIAMLQRSIATHADCLILMGGGSFQQVAAYQYMKHHQGQSKPCLYSVCTTESFSHSITKAHA